MAKTFSELGRVEAIAALFEGTPYHPFEEPLHFEVEPGECVASASRTLLEGINFNLEYFPLKHLGYKSVVEVAGELYSVMAHPRTLSVQLGISAKLDFEQISQLWQGVVTAAEEHGFKSVSLDLQPSKNGLAICVNAAGASHAERSEARSKDLVCISGRLGAAFLGQQVLEHRKEELEKYRMMLAEYLKPEIDPGIVSQLEDARIFPSFGYFVNRGLADAVKRLSRDSGFGVKVYADKIPFESGSFTLGKELDIDPVSAAMNGGDDCKILFTVPILLAEQFRKDFQTFDIIGHLAQPQAGCVLVSPDGLEHEIKAPGWN